MKYYTLAEHHTFCVESGIPNGEVWKQVAKLGWLPEGIYRDPEKGFNPKQKERQNKYKKKYRLTPEYSAWQKEYRNRPENRAKQRKDRSTPEYRAWRKEYDRKYRSTPEYKAKKKEWNKRYRRNKK